jgi:hypothetical protein
MTESDWRKRIRKDVQSANPFLWVIDGKLACSPRPLRYDQEFGGRLPSIPLEAAPKLSDWLNSLKSQGIGTIVCLATPKEMQRYALVVSPHSDLLSMYRSYGFVVRAHAVEDPLHAAASQKQGILEQMERLKSTILAEYKARTGAMLIHCSGGVDRTTPITAFVASQVAEGQRTRQP